MLSPLGIEEFATLEAEVAAWVNDRNQEQSWIDWRFTTEDARVKSKRLYPTTNDWRAPTLNTTQVSQND